MTFATLDLMKTLFKGNQEFYGQFIEDDTTNEDGTKRKGSARTVGGLVTESLYRQHLEGSAGLGICPVDKNGLCNFSVIDIDVYDAETTKYYLSILERNSFPIMPFKSKSGGLHLYTFYAVPIPAKQAIDNSRYMASLLGLPKETEVFPKQQFIRENGKGNWINLPYYKGTERPMLDYDGTPYKDATLAFSLCKDKAISQEFFEQWKNNLALNDAPPCLQTIYLIGDVEQRNQYLFSLACYYKAKYKDEFEDYLYRANEALLRPLEDRELEQTVISSHRKNNYSYKCHDVPLCNYCNKQECRKRKYAVGDAISELSFEQLIMYRSDPPYYDWIVNGKELRFNSESEIIKQEKFRELCMRNLCILPGRLKDDAWTDIVNTALKHIDIRMPQNESQTTYEAVKETLRIFLLSADPTIGQEDALVLGRPFLTKSMTSIIVKQQDAYVQVVNIAKIKASLQDVARMLKEFGGVVTTRKSFGTSCRVIEVPVSSLVAPEELQEWMELKQNRINKDNQTKADTYTSWEDDMAKDLEKLGSGEDDL